MHNKANSPFTLFMDERVAYRPCMLLAVNMFIRESWRKSCKDTLKHFLWKAHLLHHFPSREDREVDKMLSVSPISTQFSYLFHMFKKKTLFLDQG